MSRTTQWLIAATAAFGCSEATSPDTTSQFVLEIEYVNYAWTARYFGFIVDRTGNVFRYDRNGQPWPEQTAYTPDELAQKFGPVRDLETTRPKSEIDAAAIKIAQLDETKLSQPKTECADAGTLTYRAYKYDATAGKYIPVLLRVEGDVARENTTRTAQELIAYIRSLGLLQELIGCDP